MKRSVVLSGVAASLVLAACGKLAPPPTDAALMATFAGHRGEFLAAVDAFEHRPGLQSVTLRDRNGKTDAPKVEPQSADPATAGRLAAILRNVGARSVSAGATSADPGASLAVRFAYLAPKRWGSKAVKGIVYDRTASPQDRVPDTDAFARRGEKAKYLYVERQIEGDWYIYQWLD
jgi:hypothetical protein